MTINFYDAVAEDGLFNLLGKAFFAQQTALNAAATTIPTEIVDVWTAHNNVTPTTDLEQAIGLVSTTVEDAKETQGSVVAALQAYCEALLVAFVEADNPQPSDDIETALIELIRQMKANSETVDASAVTLSATADAANTGDGKMILSTKRGDGRVNQNMLAEDIEVEATSSGRTATWEAEAESAEDPFGADWPTGSGESGNILAVDASSGLLANGDFEDEDDTANAPDDWIFSVAQIGTTVKMTDVEVQTLTISGSPTSGHYLWSISHDGVTKTTDPIAYNADSGTLQAAIRTLPGFESVEVTATGTTPNFTHTITFTGQGGNLNLHSITNHTDSGTFTPANSVDGTAQVFHGSKALHLDSDGSELTTMQQRVTLDPETVYAVSLWAIVDVVPAGGVITLDLVDGIGGTVIQDSEGNSNSFTFNAADLTTSWQQLSDLVSGETVFRTPLVVPDLVYFRIRISTAVTVGTSVFLDEVALFAMTELYDGGPFVAIVPGASDFKEEDKFTLTVTNDRAGLLQEWFERNFEMRSLGLLLPSDSGGAETIPDTVVA